MPPAAAAAAAQQREVWVDVLFVFLPAALIYWLLCRLIAVRIDARFLADEPRLAAWMAVLAAPFVSGLGLFLGEMWSWVIEMIRNHDMHMSYRAFRLPWVRHRLAIYVIGVGVFLLAARLRSWGMLRAWIASIRVGGRGRGREDSIPS